MEAIEYEAMHAQELTFWWYRALHDIVIARLDALSLPDRFHLLDAGCGTGGLLQKLHAHRPHATLHGLEQHNAGMQHLQTRSGILATQGNVNAMPFADNHFDVITLMDVLYHREVNPERCLAECRRVLKPGGHLLINVAAYPWMMSMHDRQVHTRERYTSGKLRRQLQEQGFRLVRAGYWNSLLFPLMVMHRLTTGRRKLGSDVETLPEWQNSACYRIIRCEQFLQRHRIHIPFGGSTWAWASKP